MILTAAIAVGLSASGITHIARAVVPQEWLLHKPLSCDLCMSFHGSWLTVLVAMIDSSFPLSAIECGQLVMAGTATAMISTKVAVRLST